MRLISCQLWNIRRHRELALQFGRELTLISGPNESGKSTLVEALHKGLFLRSTATGRGVEELRSRVHAGLPELEIRFEASGESWRLRKRFAGASGTCQLSNSSGLALSGAAAEERLAALLGFEAPVEGRRIGQLPERWAHLWVRQGDAGLNPIGGSQDSYDHKRLIEQLQQQGGPSQALESGLDRLVLERIQAQVAEFYTPTGRVRAGSALAEAQRRSAAAADALTQAQQQLNELEAAMERWRSISDQLETIETQQLPPLQRELPLLHQTRRRQARLEPLIQQASERRKLQEQQQQEQQEQRTAQAKLEALLEQQQHQGREHEQNQQQLHTTQQQLRGLAQQQERLQQLLDLTQLTSELKQLREHQRQLEQLQQEAESLKQRLATLPEITAEQVKQLRQAEQNLNQASARCEAMAASVELLSSDQRVQLNGDVLATGERRLIQAAVRLDVGTGVVLRLSPGGGDALPQALERRQQCQDELQQLRQALQIESSDAAEVIERQRQALTAELNNLRKAARAIPWSGLQQRLAQLEPRQLQLQQALATPSDPSHSELEHLGRSELESRQQDLRRDSAALVQRQEQLNLTLQQLARSLQGLQAQVDAQRTQLAQLNGSATVIAQQLDSLRPTQASGEPLEQQQQQLTDLLEELTALRGERQTDPAQAIQTLEETKAQLLSQRGQAEQQCLSLGAINPSAELEQRQATWEEAEAERRSLEQRAQALLLLQERFHGAQSDLSNRYSEPLRVAIGAYLAALSDENQQPLLQFDPQQGFHNLQLSQAGESFVFERLSGGMREQLAACVRLAMAEVLKPAYGDALPLVFDDAFTNSDRERLSGLKRMLRRGLHAGIQIILLSCHPEDYSDLLDTQTKNPPDGLGGIDAVSLSLR